MAHPNTGTDTPNRTFPDRARAPPPKPHHPRGLTHGGHSSTLLYVDPPYPASVRNSRNYQYEMPDEERHRQLADSLRSCSATVVLSGYPGRLYDDVLYADWHRYEIAASTSQSGKGQVRIEVLWSNRALL